MKVQGRRKRGRSKRRWLDKVKDDIKEKGLSADDVYDRATWRHMSDEGEEEDSFLEILYLAFIGVVCWRREYRPQRSHITFI